MITLKNLILLPILLFSSLSVNAADVLTAKSQPGKTAVLELYTSEGCSSCPPADKWLSSLKPHLSKDIHVVPLAFHVDYWNYLGWEDAYSDALYTKRQRELGALNSQRTIYTPGFYLNANETRGIRKILNRIQKDNKSDSEWSLGMSATKSGTESVTLAVNGMVNGDGSAAKPKIFIALYENDIVRAIERGENTGKTLTHDFVVRHWQGPLKADHTDDGFALSESISFPQDAVRENTGVAAILYDQKTGKAIQALSLDLRELYKSGV